MATPFIQTSDKPVEFFKTAIQVDDPFLCGVSLKFPLETLDCYLDMIGFSNFS